MPLRMRRRKYVRDLVATWTKVLTSIVSTALD
jgi:hypothetical protein